jgi:hypothetical protein
MKDKKRMLGTSKASFPACDAASSSRIQNQLLSNTSLPTECMESLSKCHFIIQDKESKEQN